MENIKKPYYLIYYSQQFYQFKYWSEADVFIKDHEGCFYKKINNNTQEQEFKKKHKGQKNYQKKIYIVIYDNSVHRFNKWADAKDFIDTHEGCYYRGFTNHEDAQEFVNKNVHLNVQTNQQDTLYCHISTKLNRQDHILSYGYRLVKNDFTLAENFNEVHNAYPADVMRKNASLIKKGVNTALAMKEERIVIVMEDNLYQLLINGSYKAKNKEMESFILWAHENEKYINIDWITKKEKGEK